MKRAQYYRLRHHIRASGWSWNGGSRLTKATSKYVKPSLAIGVAKTAAIALVGATLKGLYDNPKNMDMEAVDSGQFMRLVHEWEQCKRLKVGRRSKVWWQNYMRSNVRNDSGLFTEHLTSY